VDGFSLAIELNEYAINRSIRLSSKLNGCLDKSILNDLAGLIYGGFGRCATTDDADKAYKKQDRYDFDKMINTADHAL
jgi:hypothetical protein